jgi:hypothetical protein
VKYKCFKVECPVCGEFGSLQLFLNRENRIAYARVRHYRGKGKYTYCKIEKTQLETLLNSDNIQYPKPNIETPSQGQKGQPGQEALFETHDPQLRSSSPIPQKQWAGSSARIEHHPPKVGVVGSNPTPPAGTPDGFGESDWLFAFSKSLRLLSSHFQVTLVKQ